MRRYEHRKDLVNANLVEGELIKYNDKICRVSISRGGPLDKPKFTVVLVPLPQITITEDTEIIINN